jgi:phage replication-related protein YjqB (UPF0714/DUF867 family)
MVLNKDFREFLQLLNEHDVRYMIVGGYAVAFHGYPRYTKDLDVWVWVNPVNATHIIAALERFGFTGLSASDFSAPNEFIQLGYPPNRIDIITSCDGLEFDDCYEQRTLARFEDLEVPFIDLENLIINKKATGRPQDLGDVDNLQSK